jgi:SWI/SNF-related matrix-associated actin-dependent regulator of chromatin subfamily A3
MGLGKTISCVALIAATLPSAQNFATTPLDPPQPPSPPEPALSAEHFAGSVWGMPAMPLEPTSSKGKAKAVRQCEKLEAEYVRMCRIKTKSRATLIVCPLSTVVNWEEQFREHWRGEVEVVGGSGGICTSATTPAILPTSSSQGTVSGAKPDVKPLIGRIREGTPLRVYVYHGNARKPDPTFLANFDAVITTYSTLAVEFSKQSKSLEGTEDEDEDAGASSEGCVETDERGNQIIKLPKPKKAGLKKRKKTACGATIDASSPLQSVYWFRVVLDEAQ